MNHLVSILKEMLSSQELVRTPEKMVMSESDQTQDFYNYGLGDTVLRASYLFHAKWASKTFVNCKRVLDLGTGPANQISLVAQMNPGIEFVGVDLSDRMLALAEQNCKKLNLKNVTFIQDDITQLQHVKDRQFDGVFSSVALHHLPSVNDLNNTFTNMARVLSSQKAIYITDFLLLKNRQSIDYLLSLNKEQPKVFKDDYEASLLAAFTKSDFEEATRPVLDFAKFYSSFGAQFLMVLKSESYNLNSYSEQILSEELKKLSKENRSIYQNMSILFALRGMI